MINTVTLVGRITKDVDLRATQSGISVTQFTLAVNRIIKNENGEKQADFIQCVAWRHSAEFMKNYVKKGNLLGVTGKIQTRTYEDSDGRTMYVTEVLCDSVQLLEFNQEKPKQKEQDAQFYDDTKQTFTVNDDDLPF